jgi:cohesin complex subunit SA-1/2
MIELRHGAEVFMHYLKCYQDYGDIIKEAISKSRNLDQVTSAHTLVLSLRKQYLYLLVHHGGALDKSSQEFAQLKGKNTAFFMKIQ